MSSELLFAIAVGTLAGALIRILMSFKKKRVREAAAQHALATKQAQAARAHAASTAPARKRKRRR